MSPTTFPRRALAIITLTAAASAAMLSLSPPAEAARFAVIKVFEPRIFKLQPPNERPEPHRPAVGGMPAGALLGGDGGLRPQPYRPIAGAIIGGAIAGGYPRPYRPHPQPKPERRSWFELHTPK